MKKPMIFIAASIATFLFSALPSKIRAQTASNPAKDVLTIDNAVRQGLNYNPSLKMAIAEERRQNGDLEEAKDGRNVTLSGEANHVRNKSETDYTLDGTKIVLVPHDQSTLSVELRQNIDISGKIATAVSIADFEDVAAKLNALAVRNGVVAQIKAAYLDCLRAKDRATAAESDEKNASDRLHFVEARIKAGISPKIDLLRAQTSLSSAQTSAFEAQKEVDLSLARLKRAIGLSQSSSLSVTETGIDDMLTDENEEQTDRPEILEAEANLEAAKRGIELAKLSLLPDFSIGAGAVYTPEATAFGSASSSAQITATLTIPLFDGGLSKAKVHQAKAAVDAALAQLDDTKQAVALDVKQARILIDNASQRLSTVQAALSEAKEGYRLANLRFTQGVSALIEVSDAQTALTQAQSDAIDAQWELISARNSYDRALGRYAKWPFASRRSVSR